MIADLDQGVRRLVVLLRAAGFETTDSGDGESKPAEARAFDVPHVAIMCGSPDHSVIEAQRLVDVLTKAGVNVHRESVNIQASWSPLDGVAMVLLTGIADADFPWGARLIVVEDKTREPGTAALVCGDSVVTAVNVGCSCKAERERLEAQIEIARPMEAVFLRQLLDDMDGRTCCAAQGES